MGSVVILIIIVVASLICVRAGAIALELTGMERDKARFQALSAFTNTGFTTRETEEITHFPIRRKIVTALIVLGHDGTVSVIATFATSILQREPLYTVMNLGIIIVSLYLIYRLALWRGLTARMREFFRRQLLKRYGLCCPSLEEMLKVHEGFGVVRLVIQEGRHWSVTHSPNWDLRQKGCRSSPSSAAKRQSPSPVGRIFFWPGMS